jgi:hypothetical protein
MPALEAWPDSGTIATVASVAAAFTATVLVFRIQRELQIRANQVPSWIPPADILLLVTSAISTLGVLLPLFAAHPSSWIYRNVPAPLCAVVVVLLTAYPFALLAHYRFILAGKRTGVRGPSEPGELLVIKLAVVASIAGFAWAIYLRVA